MVCRSSIWIRQNIRSKKKYSASTCSTSTCWSMWIPLRVMWWHSVILFMCRIHMAQGMYCVHMLDKYTASICSTYDSFMSDSFMSDMTPSWVTLQHVARNVTHSWVTLQHVAHQVSHSCVIHPWDICSTYDSFMSDITTRGTERIIGVDVWHARHAQRAVFFSPRNFVFCDMRDMRNAHSGNTLKYMSHIRVFPTLWHENMPHSHAALRKKMQHSWNCIHIFMNAV